MTSLRKLTAIPTRLIPLAFVLSLGHAQLLGGIGIGLSEEFSIDTGGRVPLLGIALSSEFQIDTGGRVPAVASAASLDFIISTRGGAMGYANSAFVTIDTRDNSAVAFSARAQTITGGGLAGVTVSAWQNGVALASVGTDDRGLANVRGLFAGYYELHAQKAGHLTQVRRHVRVPEDVSSGVTFVLPTPPATPVTKDTATPPPESLVNRPRIPTTAQLRVFVGGPEDGNWDEKGQLDPAKMTVVMTHGCDSGPNEWALPMARKMAAIPGLSEKVNLVAWDWHERAGSVFVPVLGFLGCYEPRQWTPVQGLYLGQALYDTLGRNYDQPVHFIGHSLGTLVNCAAVNFLHNDDPNHPVSPKWDWNKTQVTLFDEAALAPDIRLNWHVLDYVTPVPEHVKYLENYVSIVGFPHSRGVNVLLQAEFQSHSNPYVWYQLTIETPLKPKLGFGNSFEYAAARGLTPSFPVPQLYQEGSLFRQDICSSDPLSLVEVLRPEGVYEKIAVKVAELELGALCKAEVKVEEVGLWSINKGVQGADYVVDKVSTAVGAVVKKSGQVSLKVVESILDNVGGSLNPMDDPVYGVGQTTPAILAVPGLLQATEARSTYSLQAELQTQPLLPRQLADRNALPAGGELAANIPAYVWLPLNVPADAVGLAFDFRLTGDGASDRVVAGMGSSNLFNVNVEFLPSNRWVNSGFLPITHWAGQEAEFFLGVAGGTSTNATLLVQNIRFVGLPQPILETLPVEGRMVLTWVETVPGLLLEFSPNLAAPDWSPITNTTRYISQHVYTNVVSSTQGFYRLRTP